MNRKRREWMAAQDAAKAVIAAGQGVVLPTERPASQVDVINEGNSIWAVYVNGTLLISFNNEDTAEKFSQNHANILRSQGHRVFRTIQS